MTASVSRKGSEGAARRPAAGVAFRKGVKKKEAGMKLLVCVLALAGIVALSGCSVMALGPVVGMITVDEKGPVSAGDMAAGSTKVGTAQAEGILIVAYGDASISTAMKQAGITKVHHVDNETFNVLGIYAKYKTVVYGE
jgi:hypothetical protein